MYAKVSKPGGNRHPKEPEIFNPLSTHPSTGAARARDRKSTRLNSSHLVISYAVFCLKKKKNKHRNSLVQLLAASARIAPHRGGRRHTLLWALPRHSYRFQRCLSQSRDVSWVRSRYLS